MKKPLLYLLLFLLFFSCGPRDEEDDLGRKSDFEPTLGEPSLPLTIEDQECPNGPVANLGYRKIWLYNGRSVAPQEVDLRGVSGKGLGSLAIHHAFSVQVMQTGKNSPALKGAKTLRICRSSYSRDSAENAGMAMAYAVQRSHEIMKKLTAQKNTRFDLPQVDLVIPATVLQGQGHANVADNALWMQTGRHPYSLIVVYPHSVRKLQKLKAYYWEQPLILAHEYGHHVFAEIVNTNYLAHHSPTGQGIIDWTTKNILRGLNEAFADVFSYLVMMDADQDPKVLQMDHGNVYSGKNRDVRLSQMLVVNVLKRGLEPMEKSFSPAVLEEFFYPGAGRKNFFEDVHTMGLVVGHILWAMFDAKFAAFPADKASFEEHRLMRLELLLSWAQDIDARAKKYQLGDQPLLFLKRCLEAAMNRVEAYKKDQFPSFDRANFSRQYFPELIGT